jgi:hypothetical protein
LSGREDIARDDDVRGPEVDQAVAVSDRVRLVKELNRIAIVKLTPAFFEVGIGWNGAYGGACGIIVAWARGSSKNPVTLRGD